MRKTNVLAAVSLLCIIVAGVFLRFYDLNWDNYNMFHPDERNIANAVTQIHFFSQLNPHFFAYGGFSIYLYRLGADIVTFITNNTIWVFDWGHINIIGRFFSACFSILTVIPLYFLAKKVFDKLTAILSVSFFVFCVSSIQMAHFAVTESLLTLQTVLMALVSVWIFERPTRWKAILIGILFGIAVATKTTAILFFLFPLTAIICALFSKKISIINGAQLFIIIAFISSICFTIFSPYTFLDSKDFLASMQYESGVATGSIPVVYTLQFNHTIPYIFQLVNFLWQMGIVAPFCIAGFFLYLFLGVKSKKPLLYIFFSFPLVYFLYAGSWHTKFIRYMMPDVPFFIICGAALLIKIREKKLLFGNILITLLVLATNLWAAAFFSIYIHPQTRIAASDWIYTHIPFGSKILTEQWDDSLPINIQTLTPNLYNSTGMSIYNTDNGAKLTYYAVTLSNADYIILNSRRLWGTLIHLSDIYPLTSKYYTYLFAGKLGYKEIADFSSYPTLFGITINDDKSEETFQVYDHPTVRIFQNVKHYSQEQLTHILE